MSGIRRSLVAVAAATSVVLTGGWTPTASAAGSSEIRAAAPYYYKGWGDPPDPATLMSSTGVRTLTLAFMLSDGSCSPLWDRNRPLAEDQDLIDDIRRTGGDVVVSFGGAAGDGLERTCDSADALAAAYETVINAYDLKAIDIDLEGSAFADATIRARVVSALQTVRTNHPDLLIYVTMPSGEQGPDASLITEAHRQGLTVDGWTIMPFDFGGDGSNRPMATLTLQATRGLVRSLMQVYGYSEAEAYRHAGISSMNGVTEAEEKVSAADFESMLRYANRHHLARFTFWASNRDRPCTGDTTDPETNCSGLVQEPWAYTKIIGRYAG